MKTGIRKTIFKGGKKMLKLLTIIILVLLLFVAVIIGVSLFIINKVFKIIFNSKKGQMK